MNSTLCSLSFDFTGRLLIPVYGSVFVVGLVANSWGLTFVTRNWEKIGSVNLFLLNLGITDILYLLTLPFLMTYYVMGSEWIFGQTFCKVTRFCFNLNLYGSIGFLTCISVYRYLAIVHPMKIKGRISGAYSVAVAAVVWLLVSVQSVPDMFFVKTYVNKTKQKCFDTTDPDYVEDYLRYSLGWTLTGFVVPLLITLGCYGHMVVTLCRRNTTDKTLKVRCLRLLFILTLLFSLCYIPYHLLKNLNLWSRVLSKRGLCPEWSNAVYIARQISRALVSLNSALNPLVYLHGNEGVLAKLRRLVQQVRQDFIQLFSTLTTPGESVQ